MTEPQDPAAVPPSLDMERGRVIGRLEAEAHRTLSEEHRHQRLVWLGLVAAVAAIALYVWAPWNATARQAQAASDSYQTAMSNFLTCSEGSTSATVDGCWQAFHDGLTAITWPSVMTTDVMTLENLVAEDEATVRAGQLYDGPGLGTAEQAVSAELSQLIQGN